MSVKSRRTVRPRRGNLAVRTADRLRRAILGGEHAIGEPLRELELCRKYGVSRIPLREALHRLEGEGIVTLRPNRGAVVAGLSKSEVNEIAEACHLLEPHVLGLAVLRLTGETLDRAEDCLAQLDGIDDPREWASINWLFHATLYSAAERPLLVEMLSALRARADRATLLLVSDKKRRMALNHEHRAILAAARDRKSVV